MWKLVLLVALALTTTPTHAARAAKTVEEVPEPVAGVMLSRFALRDFRPIEGVKIRVNFTLYAEVDADQEQSLRKILKHAGHRVRNEVITAIRASQLRDFQQPGLEDLRQRVVARLRRALPYLPIDRLLIGEYSYFTE